MIRVDIAAPSPSLAEAGFLNPSIAAFETPPAPSPGAGSPVLTQSRPVFPVSGAQAACRGIRIADRMPGGTERPHELPAEQAIAACPQSEAAAVELPRMPEPAPQNGLPPAAVWLARDPEPAGLSSPPVPPVYPALRIREPQAAPGTSWPSRACAAWLERETRIQDAPDLRVETLTVLVRPRAHIQMPGPASAQETAAVATGQYVKSELRIAALAGARPLEVLAKGEGLAACAYRTRSML
ncbi:MAG: hypothetical protein ACM336_20920 [Acidobacteriota bacterium]